MTREARRGYRKSACRRCSEYPGLPSFNCKLGEAILNASHNAIYEYTSYSTHSRRALCQSSMDWSG